MRLREVGWVVHQITDHFENDAQDVSDPAWIEYGLTRGWSLLTQDKRIRTQVAAQELLNAHSGLIFCLSNGELPLPVRAARFLGHRLVIHQFVARGEAGFFVVYENEVVRRWP